MATHTIRKLDGSGDSKYQWDTENEDEVAAAKAYFNELTVRKFTAFSVDKEGEKKEIMKKFDPEAGMIIMVPIVGGG